MARKRIYDIYYNQFHASISAENLDEACKIFRSGKCIIKPCKNARFKKSCFSFEAEYGSGTCMIKEKSLSKKQGFKLVNYSDPLEEHDLKATNTEDAALEALDMLGYGICSKGLNVKEWVRLLKKVKKQKAGEKECLNTQKKN